MIFQIAQPILTLNCERPRDGDHPWDGVHQGKKNLVSVVSRILDNLPSDRQMKLRQRPIVQKELSQMSICYRQLDQSYCIKAISFMV